MNPLLTDKKVAIVYDWLDSWGGAERMLLHFHTLFPHADWYTSVLNLDKAVWFQDIAEDKSEENIHTSFIQKIPIVRNHRRLSLPLYPLAFEQFDFSDYDVVLSLSSSFAKGIITKPTTKHFSFVLTPMRYIWKEKSSYFDKSFQKLTLPYQKYLQKWDYIAAQRTDSLIAISKSIQKDIKTYYERDSVVMYPPFDEIAWHAHIKHAQKPKDLPVIGSYYLMVSRLEPYKKVDLAIKTFNKLPNEHLIVVGSGSQKKSLYKLAHSNILFMDSISDSELAYLYSNAQALIMPQKEDFGYTAVEALACACPVITFERSGVAEVVEHEKTGYYFSHQTVESLLEAIDRFKPISYTVQRHLQLKSSEHITKFTIEKFRSSLQTFLKQNL